MAQDRSLPPLTALQAFHAAGAAGSFQEAARKLGVTPSAISHQIRALEEWLQRPLFKRGARQVTLTPEGRKLLKTVTAAFARIAVTAESLRGREAAAALRVSALPLFTNAFLIPRLESFEKRHPGIALQIDTTNRVVDLRRERVDVAIRNLREATPGLAAHKLLDVRPVPLCTPKIADQLTRPADLAQQTLIQVSARAGTWASWLAAVGCAGLTPRRVLSFDTIPAALEAAAQGRGVAMGLDPLVWESPVARHLVRPFRHRVAGDASYYLVYRREERVRPEIAAFVAWLRAEMALFQRRAKAPR
jgi:LysR family glycine cleavage system transcriptional activator